MVRWDAPRLSFEPAVLSHGKKKYIYIYMKTCEINGVNSRVMIHPRSLRLKKMWHITKVGWAVKDQSKLLLFQAARSGGSSTSCFPISTPANDVVKYTAVQLGEKQRATKENHRNTCQILPPRLGKGNAQGGDSGGDHESAEAWKTNLQPKGLQSLDLTTYHHPSLSKCT